MPAFRIPFIRPIFPSSIEIARNFDEIIESNRFTNFGPKERKFSGALQDFLGQSLQVTTFANGTLALLAAVRCTLGTGDSSRALLMPSFTFAAVPQAAIWNGYVPWFIDIDPTTWQASPDAGRRVLNSHRDRVAGILLPNVAGVGSPHIAEWEQLAEDWGLPIVIDSAAGFGSRYQDGERLGARGACEIFSFHATKPFAIGEGGALASRDQKIIEQANGFQNFGFNESRLCLQLGMNGKLSEISAAIGLLQLVDLESRLASRQATFGLYRAALSPLGLRFQSNAESSALQYANVCCTSPAQKENILRTLGEFSIEGRDYYNPPLHMHPYFKDNANIANDLRVTEEVCARIVSLPIHDHMAPEDAELVVKAVTQAASVQNS